MQGSPHDHHEVVEHLDADAVCEACGNVNPEGTLLCKVCGNNLRDQRVRRMQKGAPVTAAKSSVSVLNIVRGVFILFGICVVLWVAFNVSTIEDWLLHGVQRAEASNDNSVAPESFWTGPGAARYDELADALAEHPLTISEAGAVPPGSAQSSLDGRYVLRRSTSPDSSPVGSALAKADGDSVYFVARLVGGTEIRGSAQKTSDTLFQAFNIGVLDPDGAYGGAYGYAQMQSTGELACTGIFGEYEQQINIVAIPLEAGQRPAAGAGPASEPQAAAPVEPVPAEPPPAAQ